MTKFVLVFLLSAVLYSCIDIHKANVGKIEYIPLKDYSFIPAELPSGTPVRIIGYSGGRETRSKNSILLYEFLCINLQTRDTVKIFSSLISVDNSDNPQAVYSTPALFDREKKVYEAVFVTIDPQIENEFLMVNATDDPKDIDVTKLNEPAKDFQRFVVLNKGLPLMIEPRFKSAFGCLNFKKQPW